KDEPEDILIRISIHNRGPESAQIHVLPTLWFRNTWSSGEIPDKPKLRKGMNGSIETSDRELGKHTIYCEDALELLFTENETNNERLWGQPNASPYVKDAFHEFLIRDRREAVNPAQEGTKAAAHYRLDIPAGEERVIRLRLGNARHVPFTDFDQIFAAR